MANWRLAKSLEQLRQQINAASPGRSKASDGSIGDAAHSARESDHNPNAQGVVCAIDVTHDPAHSVDGNVLSRALIKDHRVKYVIFNSQIWKARTGKWEAYHGANAHHHHCHVSVKQEVCDVQTLWPWPPTTTHPSVSVTAIAPSAFVSPQVEPQPPVAEVSAEDAAKGVKTSDQPASETEGAMPPAQAVEVKASRPSIKSTAVAIFTFLMAPLSYLGIDAHQVGAFAMGNLTLAIKVGAGLALVIIAVWIWNRAMDRAQERTNKLMDAAMNKDLNNVRLVGGKDPVATTPKPGEWIKDSDAVRPRDPGTNWKAA